MQKEAFSKTFQAKLEFPQPTKMTSKELPKVTNADKADMTSKREGSLPSKTQKEDVKLEKVTVPEEKSSVVIVKQPLIQKFEGVTSMDLKSLRPVPPSYAQAVRNKIKKNLDSEKPTVEGDVFVRFVITSDGELQELRIIDENSTENGFLRETVFEAIKNSSPFPKFPKGIEIPEVTFTCQISFEIK